MAYFRTPVEEKPIPMRSLQRLALLLVLTSPALHAVLAQSSSSTSPTQDQVQSQDQAQQPAAESQQLMSVQDRIRLRREQRRSAAIHQTYGHPYESYITFGYLRFRPGPKLQRLTYYGWDTGLTHYYNDRLGVNFDARGYDGMAFVGLNFTNDTRYKVSQYDIMLGPTYRFYMQPKYSISGRVLGGWALGNFTGDTGGEGSICPPSTPHSCLLYPDGSSYAFHASVMGDYNISPSLSLRLAPEYMITGFGSDTQASRGFTIGLVYRAGK
jgi:hypothetical protein